MAETMLEDPQAAGSYDPGLYQSVGVAEAVDGFDNVTDAVIARFHQDGFLPIAGAFSPAQVDDALNAVTDMIDGKNPKFRYTQFEKGKRKEFAALSGPERRKGVRKLNRFIGFDERLNHFATAIGILGTLERIFEKPPKLFRNQAMLKPARIGREKPWHQDHAYFNLPMGTCIVSVWIALDEATLENGCMHVIPGSHREGPVVHFKRRDWQICDTHIARTRVVAVPLKPGGILFWNGLLHHGTPANRSNRNRRSLQLHFITGGVDETPARDRLEVFGSDGKNVTC